MHLVDVFFEGRSATPGSILELGPIRLKAGRNVNFDLDRIQTLGPKDREAWDNLVSIKTLRIRDDYGERDAGAFLTRRNEHEVITYTGHPLYAHPGNHDALRRLQAVAGWDIGKAAHPSHVAVLLPSGEDADPERWYQVASIWLPQGTPYIEQLARVKELAGELNVRTLSYDATRGELEALREQGNLDHRFEPVTFSAESKALMAGVLNLALEQGRLRLLDDRRQERSILQVRNNLQADDSPATGHGDAFWSVSMALKAGSAQPAGAHLLGYLRRRGHQV